MKYRLDQIVIPSKVRTEISEQYIDENSTSSSEV